MTRKLFCCLVAMLLIPIQCNPIPNASYTIPPTAEDGWQTAGLEEVGLDAEELIRLIARIRNNTYRNVHALLIVKDAKLVLETYFSGYTWAYDDEKHQGELVDFNRDMTHNLASVTKSVTSILVGITMDHGYLSGVQAPVFDYFPEYAHLNNEQKNDLTLEHLLTMSSGFAWNETELPYSDRNNDLVQLFYVSDPVGYILAKPMVADPGTRFNYCGGNTNLLGEVIRATTGQRMDAFAETSLFAPLGITNYAWDFINPDMIHASGNLRLRPRDMAKLGYLYLNGGVWQGERIVSETWIADSTQKHVSHSATSGYGYQWWLETYRVNGTSVDTYSALGWGGQRITVIPDLNMVVVMTGGNYVERDPNEEILTQYILPSVLDGP